MDIKEYKLELDQNIKASAQANNEYEETEFINYIASILLDVEEISNFEECFFQWRGYKNKSIQIDGYSYDEADRSFSLFINDYLDSNQIESLSNTEIKKLYSKMYAFIEQSINGYIIKNCEPSSQGYGVALHISELMEYISKFKLYIITNKELSSRVKVIKVDDIHDKPVEINVWDIKRLYNIVESNMEKEIIEIDLLEFGMEKLPCIKAVDCEAEKYKSYLTAIPGNVLADIYIKYGSRLLEGNVRSFLSTRGKVNKQIRSTILNKPDMFFAYNNGIAATATDIKYEDKENVVLVKKIINLQIINGGQTTASIANAVLQDKKDVSKVMVPMKLSIVDDEKAEEMVPVISRCANSQNKVDEADFFANHPYHIKIEEFSRKVYAPAVNGNQYQTIWFYERARGQHTQEQMKLTPAKKKSYLLQKPKNQIIKKVDFAKYRNTYACYPHIVSKGAQANMRHFAERANKLWEDNSAKVNKLYYQESIALAIIFRGTEKLVSNQEWYKVIKAYRANIVTYSLAVIFNYINKNLKDYKFDFIRIWNNQSLYKELEDQLKITTKEVYNFITREDRLTQNVTEWCKKQICWERAQKEKWTITREFINSLILKEEIKKEEKEAIKEQKMENEINLESEIIKLGSRYWGNMFKWGKERKLISPIEENALKIAKNMDLTGRIPSFSQCKLLYRVKERLKLEGYI